MPTASSCAMCTCTLISWSLKGSGSGNGPGTNSLILAHKLLLTKNLDIATQDWSMSEVPLAHSDRDSVIPRIFHIYFVPNCIVVVLPRSLACNAPFYMKFSFLPMQCSEMCSSHFTSWISLRTRPCPLNLLSNDR